MIYYILFLHFLGDFVFQTDKMAKGKSTNLKWLSLHILEYMAVLFVGLFLLGNFAYAWKFALLNGGLHLMTDYFTSKLTSHFHKQNKIHDFFIVIGADQLIHACCLIWIFQNT